MTARTIYIVDDSPEFLESLRFWLDGAGFEVHGWVDPRPAIDALVQRDPDIPACLMLDLRMPALSGLDMHDALLQRRAEVPVIYMSGHADVPRAVQAMQKGAVTLLEKPFDDTALEAALDAAFARCQQQVPQPLTPAGEDKTSADDEAKTRFAELERRLSPRERQVLGFVIQGIYNKNIADRMGLSVKTIELYRARGMTKMRARSIADLTRMMVTRQVSP
jgi:two-component system, LuxR family, response regulator FixJ